MNSQDDIKILFADDQPFMRETVRNILRSKGYKKIDTVSDGREAVRSVRSDKLYDLVIADWNMPNINGIELLKIIKNDIGLFKIPFLMLTGEGSPEMVLYALEEDVDAFIVKPFTPVRLIDKVKSVIEQAKKPDELNSLLTQMKYLKLSGSYKEALEVGYEILTSYQNPKAMFFTIECLYHIKEYDKAIQMAQDSKEDSQSSKHLGLIAKVYQVLGRQKNAIEYLERASLRNPLNQSLKVDLARAYFSAHRNDDAENIINTILQSEATDLISADITQLYIDQDDLDKAAIFMEKAGYPIKETAHIFNNYAVALRKAGRYDESLEVYKKCIKVEQESDVLYYNLGLLYNIIGNSKEAKAALEKSVELNPQNESAEKLLSRLGKDDS